MKDFADIFLASNSNYFPEDKIYLVKEKLQSIPEDKEIIVQSMEKKDPTNMLLFSIFLGSLGVDRFMLGDTGLGVLKLLTAGACGIWTIVDCFTVQKRAKEFNFNKLMSTLSMV